MHTWRSMRRSGVHVPGEPAGHGRLQGPAAEDPGRGPGEAHHHLCHPGACWGFDFESACDARACTRGLPLRWLPAWLPAPLCPCTASRGSVPGWRGRENWVLPARAWARPTLLAWAVPSLDVHDRQPSDQLRHMKLVSAAQRPVRGPSACGRASAGHHALRHTKLVSAAQRPVRGPSACGRAPARHRAPRARLPDTARRPSAPCRDARAAAPLVPAGAAARPGPGHVQPALPGPVARDRRRGGPHPRRDPRGRPQPARAAGARARAGGAPRRAAQLGATPRDLIQRRAWPASSAERAAVRARRSPVRAQSCCLTME